MKKVKMYTSIGCIYCIVMSDFFEKNKIKFEEIDIMEDDQLREDVMNRSGLSSVPIIEIEGKFYTVGDKEKIKKALSLKSRI